MTRIDFFHDAPDKLAAACKFASDACAQGRKVVVFARERSMAARFDHRLWSVPSISFVPHCRADNPLAKRTPVVIAESLDNTPHDDLLINLDPEPPQGFARFHQLIEIVGQAQDDRLPARERFRFYRERGYPLQSTPYDAQATP